VYALDHLNGKQFGDFVVAERIGRGGAASVYRARQQSVGRDVALKVIDLSALQEQDDFQKRFAKEAELIAKLEHIHILPVYAYGIEGDNAYLAMRLLRGGSLKDLLKGDESLSLDMALKLFRQVAQGLAYAHSKGVIHRDIKPANVLLDDNQNAYLSDFGLAKVNAEADITQNDVIVGTLTYMSPEHLRGERLDQRTDVYGIGIMLYEMLCGRPPFTTEEGEDSIVGMVYKHLEKMPPPMNDFNPNISHELETVVMRSLSKNRDDRYFDMSEFVKAIDGATGAGNSSASLPRAAVKFAGQSSSLTKGLPLPTTKQNPVALWGFVGAVILAVVVGAVALLSNRAPDPVPTHTVLEGEVGLWDAFEPSAEQIALAQRKLGTEGFVAVVACNSTSEYHTTLTREMTSHLRSKGLRFKVYDSQSDGYTQRLEMEKALTEGATAFVLCPITYDTITQTLDTLNAEKIPFTAVHTPPQYVGGSYTSTEDADYQMGNAIGTFAGSRLNEEGKQGEGIIILDFSDMESIVIRANGIEEGIRGVLPEANIVGRYTGGTRDFGYESVKKLLEEGVEFSVIASINDAGSVGAAQALQDAGVPFDAVDIYSIDAEQLVVEKIQRGEYFRASLEVGRSQTAKATTDLIVQMLAGATVPEIIDIPMSNIVTQDNADEQPNLDG